MPTPKKQRYDTDERCSLDIAVEAFGRMSMDGAPTDDGTGMAITRPRHKGWIMASPPLLLRSTVFPMKRRASFKRAKTMPTSEEHSSLRNELLPGPSKINQEACDLPLKRDSSQPSLRDMMGPDKKEGKLTDGQVEELRRLRRELCEAFLWVMLADDEGSKDKRKRAFNDLVSRLGYTRERPLVKAYNGCHLKSFQTLAEEDASAIFQNGIGGGGREAVLTVQNEWIPRMTMRESTGVFPRYT